MSELYEPIKPSADQLRDLAVIDILPRDHFETLIDDVFLLSFIGGSLRLGLRVRGSFKNSTITNSYSPKPTIINLRQQQHFTDETHRYIGLFDELGISAPNPLAVGVTNSKTVFTSDSTDPKSATLVVELTTLEQMKLLTTRYLYINGQLVEIDLTGHYKNQPRDAYQTKSLTLRYQQGKLLNAIIWNNLNIPDKNLGLASRLYRRLTTLTKSRQTDTPPTLIELNTRLARESAIALLEYTGTILSDQDLDKILLENTTRAEIIFKGVVSETPLASKIDAIYYRLSEDLDVTTEYSLLAQLRPDPDEELSLSAIKNTGLTNNLHRRFRRNVENFVQSDDWHYQYITLMVASADIQRNLDLISAIVEDNSVHLDH